MKKVFLLSLVSLLAFSVANAATFSVFDPISDQTLKGQIDSSGYASVYNPTFGVTLTGHTKDGAVFVFDPISGVSLKGKIASTNLSTSVDTNSIIVGLCTQYKPQAKECTTEANYQTKSVATGLYGFTSGISLDECRKQIDSYQGQVTKFNNCMIDEYGYNPITGQWSPTKTQQEQIAANNVASNEQPVKTISNTLPENPNKKCQATHGVDSLYNYQTGSCTMPATTSTESAQTQKLSCPINSTPNTDGSCTCDKGYGGGFGIDVNKCLPTNQVMSESCANLYGPQTHYNTSLDMCECSKGYVFKNGSDAKNNQCVSGITTPASVKSTLPTGLAAESDLRNKLIAAGVSTSSTHSMSDAEAQAWIKGLTTAQTKQKHWYEWFNPINWFGWWAH